MRNESRPLDLWNVNHPLFFAGKCRGNFVLYVNKMGGATSATPGRRLEQATPKNPNKFALFVKENYKTVRTPGVKHEEAMKLLSQKFSTAKLQ